MLLIDKAEKVYDLSQVKQGYLFYGKHRTWNEGKAGIVTTANERELIVQYYPGIANVTNHFVIPAIEVCSGEWELRWSADLSEVFEYTAIEQEETDESRTTDL